MPEVILSFENVFIPKNKVASVSVVANMAESEAVEMKGEDDKEEGWVRGFDYIIGNHIGPKKFGNTSARILVSLPLREKIYQRHLGCCIPTSE